MTWTWTWHGWYLYLAISAVIAATTIVPWVLRGGRAGLKACAAWGVIEILAAARGYLLGIPAAVVTLGMVWWAWRACYAGEKREETRRGPARH